VGSRVRHTGGNCPPRPLEPQPGGDDAVVRGSDYEKPRAAPDRGDGAVPNSTVDISKLRLVVDYQRQNRRRPSLTWYRRLPRRRLLDTCRCLHQKF